MVKIVGIVNVTPDSFSDGGRVTAADAVQHALQLIYDGADVLDIGGESTRPGAEPVSLTTELQRVLPVISGIREIHQTIPISIDTTKAEVAYQAIQAGATIVNDVSAGRLDAGMFQVVAEANVPIILMHMQGIPGTMQIQPTYNNVVEEVCWFLNERIELARSFGITQVIVDTGIGFGKTLEHNLELLKNLGRFAVLPAPMMLGISRKAWVGKITNVETPDQRDAATMIAHTIIGVHKAAYIRVHNVQLAQQMRQLHKALTF